MKSNWSTPYILPSGGLYATYHLLGEPKTTIELSGVNSPYFMTSFWAHLPKHSHHIGVRDLLTWAIFFSSPIPSPPLFPTKTSPI